MEALKAVSEAAKKGYDTSSHKSRQSRRFDLEGFYIKDRNPDENYRMTWNYPGNRDVEHVTLETKDLTIAKGLVVAFVLSIGADAEGRRLDPLVTAVIRRFLDGPLKKRTANGWKSQLNRLNKLVQEHYPDLRMSECTTGVQKILIKHMAPSWGVNSIRTCMGAFSKAVTTACEPDDDGVIFAIKRHRIVLDVNTICNLINSDPPEEKTWHPELDGMVQVLQELANHEPVRRWAFLALFTAMRPSHILELNPKMLGVMHGVHAIDTKRTRETAAEEYAGNDEFFNNTAEKIKRRPKLPVPVNVYEEMTSWGDGRWVNVSSDTVHFHINRAAKKLNMPELVPSSFRDFCATYLKNCPALLGGQDVPSKQSELWLGHRIASKIHMGYGRIDTGTMGLAVSAVIIYMDRLDKESGGVLFRQSSARSCSASDGAEASEIGDDIPKPYAPADVAASSPETPCETKKINGDKELDEPVIQFEKGPVPALKNVPEQSTDVAPASSAEIPAEHIADDWHRGSLGETTGLTGLRMHETGQIEGFKGLFRRVTDGREGGIWGDEFKRVGAKYVLPNITAWFRVEGIQIYDTDVSCKDIKPTRLFIDTTTFIVIDVSEISSRMIVSLGRELVGWRNHSSLLEAPSEYNNKPALEYRDPIEEGQVPRGLLELIGPHSVLGNVRGIPRWFEEVPVVPVQPPLKGNKIDWRYMLRNLQCFFDINHIRVYEADLIINRELRRMRLFADSHTEKVLEVAYVRSVMLAQLGCDPGGWAEHSSKNEVSNFNVEEFICTTPLAACLDKSDKFEGDDGFDIAVGWH